MNEMTAAAPANEAARRRWLLAGVAGAAVAAGAGFAWWRLRPGDAEAGAVERMWGQSFDTPAGGTLALASLKGRPLLVNFWATWCPPCVEEMPLLDRFYREHAAKGWQVVGLAIDQPSSVRTFLQRTPVTFPIGLAGLQGTELTRSLGNAVGGLPFSVVFGPDGDLHERRMGQVSEADLQTWAGRW